MWVDEYLFSDTINKSFGIYAWYRHKGELNEVNPQEIFILESSAHPSSAEVFNIQFEVNSKIPLRSIGTDLT